MSNCTLLLAGPTALGKSELAVSLAERLDGEIVGADAFQVYRGLDLLTAKPSSSLRARIPHHLIGEVPLSQTFDVAQYLVAAKGRIAEIQARGRVPIVVGGTGLYFRALIHGLAELPPADSHVREELELKTVAELQAKVRELDPQGAAEIDLKNPRRLIRAIEVCLLTGKPFSSFRQQWAAPPDPTCVGFSLETDRDSLNRRIDARVIEMFHAGVIEEVAAIGELSPTAEQVLGLREIRALIAGERDESTCIASIQQATRQYAKRQRTWFRKESALSPVDATGADLVCRIAGLFEARSSGSPAAGGC